MIPLRLGAPEVDGDVAKCEDVRAVRGEGARAAEQRFDAREQLRHFERLRQIVVRAELETEYAVDDLAPRGEHQDRRLDAARAEIAADVEAVFLREGDVEQQQ